MVFMIVNANTYKYTMESTIVNREDGGEVEACWKKRMGRAKYPLRINSEWNIL